MGKRKKIEEKRGEEESERLGQVKVELKAEKYNKKLYLYLGFKGMDGTHIKKIRDFAKFNYFAKKGIRTWDLI